LLIGAVPIGVALLVMNGANHVMGIFFAAMLIPFILSFLCFCKHVCGTSKHSDDYITDSWVLACTVGTAFGLVVHYLTENYYGSVVASGLIGLAVVTML